MVLFELEKKQLNLLPNRDILIKYHSDIIEIKMNFITYKYLIRCMYIEEQVKKKDVFFHPS